MRCFRCGSLNVDVVGEGSMKEYRLSFYECGFCGFFQHVQQRRQQKAAVFSSISH